MSLKHLAQFFPGIGPSIAGIFYPSPDTHIIRIFSRAARRKYILSAVVVFLSLKQRNYRLQIVIDTKVE
jgi:hypothetical protein